jgi:hypothetical protein
MTQLQTPKDWHLFPVFSQIARGNESPAKGAWLQHFDFGDV